MTVKIPLARYLFTRLHQLNCRSIHGVPGDFFLRALDHIEPAGLRWIGNANELCAGYAADGYARAGWQHRLTREATPRCGAVFTTYGVGELSAINAIAGAWAENVPVVHLVGTPARRLWREARLIHHSPGDGRMGVYAEMAKKITCAQADLQEASNAEEAGKMFDQVLEQCVRRSKPVYVQLPSDMCESPISASELDRALQLTEPVVAPEEVKEMAAHVLYKLECTEQPLIIADGMSYGSHFAPLINELVQLTGIPCTSLTSGKGIIDEDAKSWLGTMAGAIEHSTNSDLILLFGPILADTNTAGWTTIPDMDSTISFERDTITLNTGEIFHLKGEAVLRELIELLRHKPAKSRSSAAATRTLPLTPVPNLNITQDTFWPRMSSFLGSNDTVLFANGTPLIGSRDMTLPPSTQVIASPIWCSIGQMLPTAQGIAAAKQDLQLPGNTILFEGDGSFQVTCQALSDVIRYKLDVTIFIINNRGYTYERWLNGMEAEYNDVPAWQYTKAVEFFGAKVDDHTYPIFSRKAETWEQLEEVLGNPGVGDGHGLKVIEVVMAPEDVPEKSKPGLRRGSKALESSEV